MKKYTNKRIEIYVDSATPFPYYNIVSFLEKEKMPLDAVKDTKKVVDNYLNSSSEGSLYIKTYSSDIISFLYEYSKVKKYKVQIFYRSKKIGIEGIFKKFNAVFRYIDKYTVY